MPSLLDRILAWLPTFRIQPNTLKTYKSNARVLNRKGIGNFSSFETIKNVVDNHTNNEKPNSMVSRWNYVCLVLEHFPEFQDPSVHPRKHLLLSQKEQKRWKNIADNKEEAVLDETLEEFREAVEELNPLSPVFVLMRCYAEYPFRDDLKDVVLTDQPLQSHQNYLVIQKMPYSIVINEYKTSSRYPPIHHTFSAELSRQIQTYLRHFNLRTGSLLFPRQVIPNTSKAVTAAIKEIGISVIDEENAGINKIRKLWQKWGQEHNREREVDFMMRHSPKTGNQHYNTRRSADSSSGGSSSSSSARASSSAMEVEEDIPETHPAAPFEQPFNFHLKPETRLLDMAQFIARNHNIHFG